LAANRNPLKRPSSWRYYVSAAMTALLFAMVSAYVVWQVKTTDYVSGGRAALNTARLVADNFEDKFDHVDMLLQSIGGRYADGLDVDPEEKARISERMKDEIADHPIVSRFFVTDVVGQPVLFGGSDEREPSSASVSDRQYFQRAAAGEKGLIFEGPIKARLDDEWVVILARRLENAKGDFLGVAVASVPVESLGNCFRLWIMQTAASSAYGPLGAS
jgi:two-component system, sensor histidine kinase and response regulator